jgi:hypothetical protein
MHLGSYIDHLIALLQGVDERDRVETRFLRLSARSVITPIEFNTTRST